MVRKEKLADEELSLKEKYALLRKQRQQQTTDVNTPEIKKPPPEVKATPSLIDKAKLELAKKALAQSQKESAAKESGFKRPATNRNHKEEPEIQEQPKRLKTTDQLEVQKPSGLLIREKRERRNMVPPDEEVEGEYYPTTVFVGDLPEGISESELQKHFSPFGQIDCIRLISPKNFAFIKYTTREGADKAITSMNASTISNIPIRVSKARIHTAQHTWRKSWDGWSIQDKHNVTSQSFEAPVLPPTVYTPPPLPQFSATEKISFEAPRSNEYSDLVRDRTLLRYDDL